MNRNLLLCLLLAAACASSTTEGRIAKHQKQFDAYPEDVQRKIKAGVVENGWTPDMVELSLGKPDRRYNESTDKGAVQVWSWTRNKAGLGFGVGMGVGSGRGYGTGVSVGTGGGSVEEYRRVEFQGGKVTGFSEKQ